MKKITFLFGAGAEGKNNYELPSGSQYILAIIRLQEELKNVLSKIFVEHYYDLLDAGRAYTYRKDTVDFIKIIEKNMIKNKAKSDRQFFEKYEKEIQEKLNKSEYEKLKASIQLSKSEKNGVERVRTSEDDGDEFRNIFLTKNFLKKDIESDFYREMFDNDEDGKIVFDYQNVLSGVLDSYFHSIINPSKYGTGKFAKIFVYYWSCYFAIVEPILKQFTENGSNDFAKYYVNGKCNYKMIVENIHEFTRMLYQANQIENKEHTYYAYIQEYFQKSKNKYRCRGVLTTNYYNFCKRISCEDTVYLNGELKYFEYPELLEVQDLSKVIKKGKNIFFPFIFGQSHVKPIVHSVQTKSYAKMKDILDDTDILVILGYGIGEDDNHINAFLHEFLSEKDKRIIYVTEKEDREQVAKRLRVETQFQNQIVCNHEKFQDANNQIIIENIFKELEKMI